VTSKDGFARVLETEDVFMEQNVYLICFLVGLMFTLLSLFFGHHHSGAGDAHAAVGTGGHAEAGYEHSGMPGVSPFSPMIICCFLTAFGGFGLIFSDIHATSNVYVSLGLAMVSAFAVAGAVLWGLSAMFHRTQCSSEGRISTLVGATATVITPIPPAGVGEIAYVQGGSRYTAPAREQTGQAVGNGQTVKITRVSESQFFVAIL
jgi:membrane protein implicated in regulation of membrane protease activity